MTSFVLPFVPDAVVFDLDGVLVDSEGIWEAIEREVVESLGYVWDPTIRPQLLGKGPGEAAAVLSASLGADVTTADIQSATAQKSTELFARGVPVAPGALALLRGCHGQLPLAVATNSTNDIAESALVGNNLDRYFEAIVTADDVAVPKPAPDPYLLACERIGARPRHSVAIEDSPTGMASASAAGLYVIARVDDGTDTRMADHVVTTLTDLSPRALLGSAAA